MSRSNSIRFFLLQRFVDSRKWPRMHCESKGMFTDREQKAHDPRDPAVVLLPRVLVCAPLSPCGPCLASLRGRPLLARGDTRSLGLGQPRTPPLWSASRTVAKGDCGDGTLVALEFLHARAFRRVPHPHRRVGGRCTSEQRHTRGIHSSTGSILCQACQHLSTPRHCWQRLRHDWFRLD